MLPRFCAFPAGRAARLGAAFFGLTALFVPALVSAAPSPGFRALPGHIPAAAVASARAVSVLGSLQPLALALTLPLHRQPELADLLRGLSDPSDPRYGQFLTPEKFAARYSPTPAEYARVLAYAQAMGLTVTGTHANRTVLDVSAPAGQIGRAFGLHLLVYRSQINGRYFYAPDAEPQVPAALAFLVSGVVGLSNASRRLPHLRPKNFHSVSAALDPYAAGHETGSGPGGGLTPSDIKAAYSLSTVPQNGGGQALALFELDGYNPSDIAAYEAQYGLPAVPLQNVLVDGCSGVAGSGAAEVTLDIELQAALAPGVSRIIVYEGPNSDAGVVDTYNQIATDDAAKQISTSWGQDENANSPSVRSSENAAFRQMAAQGQSLYAAAGDSGAYDNGATLSVDDPASQPYVTGVGGTALVTNGAGGPYKSETTWNGGSAAGGAGGGGISTFWAIPSYQFGVAGTAASKGSLTHRNVPDVSLDADPNTGYSIYFNGQWTLYGGTSCAAPLWAAFTALVNQKRTASGSSPLGFANIPLYALARTGAYAADFHDIADSSTNLFYPAVPGYDAASGLGTFSGASLLADLGGGPAVAPTSAPAAPTAFSLAAGNAQITLSWTASTGASSYSLYRGTSDGTESLYKQGLTAARYTDAGLTNGTAYFYQVAAVNSIGTSGRSGEASAAPKVPAATIQLLGNPGFENGRKPAPWTGTVGVANSSAGQPAHSGSWKAWLDGYGSTHTDTLGQTVTLPAALASATLSFYLHIGSADKGTTAHDTLKVQIRSTSGTVGTTLATYSNLNAASGYSLKSFNLSAYKGQTIQVYLIGTENASLATSFVADDFALNVQ